MNKDEIKKYLQLKKQYSDITKKAKENGQYCQVNLNFPSIYIYHDKNEEYYFQEYEA
jgi:hypothetical protein